MDVAALRERVKNTLDANAAIRQQAELDLKHVGLPRTTLVVAVAVAVATAVAFTTATATRCCIHTYNETY